MTGLNDIDIVTLHCSGKGDMGDVTDKTSKARFNLKDPAKTGFCLVSMKVHFSEGSGSAEMKIQADHSKGTNFDVVELKTDNNVGTGGEADFTLLVPKEERPHYSWSQDTDIVCVWTDPDGAKATRWGIEIKLAPYAYQESR